MALTADERRVLTLARQMIKGGEESYICYSLWNIAHEDALLRGACNRLENYIAEALGPYGTLSGWQYGHGIESSDTRADRLAWIDWMLAE